MGRQSCSRFGLVRLAVLLLGGLSAATSASAGTAAAVTAAPAARPGDGPIWVLHGRSNSVYIAGSMHLLRPSDAQLPTTFDHAYGAASRLVMEIDMDDLDPSAAAEFTRDHATYPDGQGLRAALGGARWTRLKDACDRAGLPLEALDRMEPWAVALLYSATQMTRAGLDPQLGVEEQLLRRAAVDHKPITGLETLEFQLSLFDSLSPEAQARLLEMTVAEAGDVERELDGMGTAWRSGDASQLERLLLREYREFPDLYESLVYRRNRDWVPQVEALLQGKDDVLVVVGALHLVGERGLIDLLRRRGLQPERYTLH